MNFILQTEDTDWIRYLDEFQIGIFTLGELASSFFILLITLLLRQLIVDFLLGFVRRLTQQTRTTYDDRILDALEKPMLHFMTITGVYFSILVLPIDARWILVITQIWRGVSILLIFWALVRVVDLIIDLLAFLSRRREDASFVSFLPLLKKTMRFFLIVVGVIMVIDNLGYNVGGILATLGIGGAALAFAAKDTIANLYGSLALALDRPFKVGDWIQVGDVVDGDVEEIGLRSTKVRTWPKTVISIPNAVLANEMINNWSRMPKRRVKQIVGVTYDTSPDTVNLIVEDIRQLLREDDGVQQDFMLVNWTDFGQSSLDILVYYFTTTTKWLEYMDVRQRINTKIAKAIATRGSSVAFPTRTLHFGNSPFPERPHIAEDLPDDAGPQLPA